jgi:phosphoribosyl-AMP cyclohydrolase
LQPRRVYFKGSIEDREKARGKNLWKKGETSGHLQKIINITSDCDYDCILLEVEQIGNACHTGAKTCFFNKIIS